MNKVPRWVFRYVGNKTFDFSSKKKDFLPTNDQIDTKWENDQMIDKHNKKTDFMEWFLNLGNISSL